MRRAIEDEFRWVNGISDDNDFGNIVLIAGLIDSTPYGKKFCLRACNEYSVMDCFDEGRVGLMYMHNRRGNVVFDAGISYNESGWREGVLENQIIEFLSVNIVFSFFIG